MANWYTADLHFNHSNIIQHYSRPFGSAKEMDKELLRRMQCVDEDDDLWILGDFAFARNAESRRYVAELYEAVPGRKHLVRGNHDHKSTLSLPWSSVQDLAEIKDNDQNLVLCHYPLLTWNRARYGALHLFGHVHDQFSGYAGALNVGVDCWDFRPLRLSKIQSQVRRLVSRPAIWVDGNNDEKKQSK